MPFSWCHIFSSSLCKSSTEWNYFVSAVTEYFLLCIFLLCNNWVPYFYIHQVSGYHFTVIGHDRLVLDYSSLVHGWRTWGDTHFTVNLGLLIPPNSTTKQMLYRQHQDRLFPGTVRKNQYNSTLPTRDSPNTGIWIVCVNASFLGASYLFKKAEI